MKFFPQIKLATLFIIFSLSIASCKDSDVESTIPGAEIKQITEDAFAEAELHDANVPGIIVGVWDNSTSETFVYATGYADTETSEKMTRQHSVKIASVTKTIVCTIIAQLVDEGKLDFDSKLSAWFPELKKADQITIRMLGDMTTGYDDYLTGDFEEEFDDVPNFKVTPMELVEEGTSREMLYEPGEGFNYSNTNTVLLGLIIEKITGNPLEEEMKARIFNPLGLSKTGAPAEGSYLPEPRAESYHPDTRTNWTDKMDYSPEYACGNAYSTFDDLKIYIEALAGGELETAATFARRFEKGNSFPGTEYHKYYFGMIDYRGFLGHSGNTDYYLTEAFYNPELKKGIIIFSNTSTSGFTNFILERIVPLLLAE